MSGAADASFPGANLYRIPVEDIESVKARIKRRTHVSDSGCWIWPNKRRDGYAQTLFQYRKCTVHRLSYAAFKGEIPAGMTIDHLCRVPACCNPDHLEMVSHRENVLRGNGACARNSRKTHCKRGHEFTPENTMPTPNTPHGRSCRTCKNDYVRKFLARKRSSSKFFIDERKES